MSLVSIHPRMVALLAVLAVLVSCATAQVLTTPTQPLVDVPFLATPGLAQGSTLYLTRTTCTQSNAVGAICTVGGTTAQGAHNATTCSFTITSAVLQSDFFRTRTLPALYWCSSSWPADSAARPFALNKALITPGYIYNDPSSAVVFSDATPVGATANFHDFDDCGSATVSQSVTLGPSLAANIVGATGTIVYVCISIPTGINGVAPYLTGTSVYVSTRYTLGTLTGLRYTSVVIGLNINPDSVSLSRSPNCIPLAQPATLRGTASPRNTLNVTVVQGEYYFCAMTGASDVFVPASSARFTVTEYGVQPRAMYAGQATGLTLTRSAIRTGVAYEAALFTTNTCTGTAVIPWSQSLSWTAPAAVASYYACVREAADAAGTTAYAGTVVVSAMPAVTFSRNPGVIGLALGGVVQRNRASGVITVGLAAPATATGVNPCDTLIASGATATADSTAVELHVLAGAPPQTVVCIGSPVSATVDGEEADAPYLYPVLTLYDLRSYHLTFGPLRAGPTLNIELDDEISFPAQTKMKLVPSGGSGGDAGCAATAASGAIFAISPSSTSLAPVVFPTAGTWLLCVSEPERLGGQYVQLRALPVYGAATLAPSGLVSGVPTTVTVTAIPPSARVYFTTESACSVAGDNSAVADVTASAAGVATFASLAYSGEGTLRLCVTYAGESAGAVSGTAVYQAGAITVAPPTVFPGVAIEGQDTPLSFLVPDPQLLVGGLAYLLKQNAAGTVTCQRDVAAPNDAAYQMAIVHGSTATAMPVAVLNPALSDVNDNYVVCVGFANHFVPAGTVSIVGPFTMAVAPADVPAGLPMSVTLGGGAFTALSPTAFAVVDESTGCTDAAGPADILVSGTINSNGTTSVFLAPPLLKANTVRRVTLCARLTVSGSTSYVEAGVLALYPFTAVSQFVTAGTTNNLRGWPESPYASTFLARCADPTACTAASATPGCTAATTQYVTGPSQVLVGAPEGTYHLCQRSTTGGVGAAVAIVGANTTVRVVPAWRLTIAGGTFGADAAGVVNLRQRAPVTVLLTGGPTGAAAGASYTVRAQLTSAACDASVTPAQHMDFTVPVGTDTTVTIDDSISPIAPITFCVVPSATDGFAAAQANLLFYMFPATMEVDTVVQMRSALLTGGGSALAMISSTADCGNRVSTTAATIVNSLSTLTVPGCATATARLSEGHYCESANGGATYTRRGTVALLRRSAAGCPGVADAATASIVPTTASPGQPIASFGVVTSYLVNPRLSRSANCAANTLLADSVSETGYFPTVHEDATFYVCTSPIDDATTVFTTSAATLRVANWAVAPTAVRSRYNATMGELPSTRMTVNFPTPSTQTFFSVSDQCSTQLASAAGFAGATPAAVTLSTTAINGLLYLCTADGGSATNRRIAVADFLSVTPPTVVRASPAVVRGAAFSATLVVRGANGGSPVYSMQTAAAAAAADFTYGDYFISATRDVFLSADQCNTVLAGTEQTSVNAQDAVTISTDKVAASLTQNVQLCTGTPAGAASAMVVPVARGDAYPESFVTGLSAPIYIPAFPNTRFTLSLGTGTTTTTGDCAAAGTTGLPSFTTDAEGYATLVLLRTVGKSTVAAQEGIYSLCHDTAGTARALDATAAAAAAAATMRALNTTITVSRQTQFAIRGRDFFVGVPATMALLYDLDSNSLLAGFSQDSACLVTGEAYGRWTASEGGGTTAISVTATAISNQLYLCARSPVNGSLAALPGAGAVLRFAAPPLTLPTGNVLNTCDLYTLGGCVGLRDRAPADARLSAVFGSCCASAEDRTANTVSVGPSHPVAQSCELQLSATAVAAHPEGSRFSVCATSASDESYCATLGLITADTNCTASPAPPSPRRGLSKGAIAAIVVCSVIGGLGLIALVAFLVWWFRCRNRNKGDDDSESMYDGMGEADDKDAQLVPLRHQELLDSSAGDLNNASGRLINPLAYSGGATDGGANANRIFYYTPSPSSADGNQDPASLLNRMEEDVRDTIALSEARSRYNLRLAYLDAIQRLEQQRKAEDIDVGLEEEEGAAFSVGTEQPVRREVELIHREEGDDSAVGDHQLLEHTDNEDTEYEDESGLGNTSLAERRRLSSRSIESSRPSTPRRRESFMTDNDEDDDGDEGGSEEEEEENVFVDASADGATPRRSLVIRHQTSRQSTDFSGGGGARGSDATAMPRPSNTSTSTTTATEDDVAATPTSHTYTDHHHQEEEENREVPVVGGGTPYAGTARSLDLDQQDPMAADVSSIVCGGDGDAPSAAGMFPCMSMAAYEDEDEDGMNDRNHEANDDAEEDEEEDLDYTTTQLYHDEVRFLLASEEALRQRISNWEGEERAAVAQECLGESSSIAALRGDSGGEGSSSPERQLRSPPPPQRHPRHRYGNGNSPGGASPGEGRRRDPSVPLMADDGSAAGQPYFADSNTTSTANRNRKYTTTTASNTNTTMTTADGDDEDGVGAYTAPAQPAGLPPLPPAPPQHQQQSYQQFRQASSSSPDAAEAAAAAVVVGSGYRAQAALRSNNGTDGAQSPLHSAFADTQTGDDEFPSPVQLQEEKEKEGEGEDLRDYSNNYGGEAADGIVRVPTTLYPERRHANDGAESRTAASHSRSSDVTYPGRGRSGSSTGDGTGEGAEAPEKNLPSTSDGGVVVRLSKELKDIQASPEPDIKLEPYDRERHDMRALKQTTTALPPAAGGADLYSWIAAVSGPPDSPFEGGTYHVLLRVPRDYPMSPPAATFLTHVFHPNVNFATGEICLDILKHRWSPAWTLSSVCRAISSLLACPEADSPLNCDAGNLVRAGDMVGYRAMVRLYAIEDAGAPPFPEGQ